MRRKSTKRGFSTIELVTAASMTAMAIGGAVAVLYSGSASWAKGMGKIQSQTEAQMAVRVLSQQLRQAMQVTVQPDGMGLSYRLPKTSNTGVYIFPHVWDGVTRYVYLRNGTLSVSGNQGSRVLATGVVLTDPTTPSNPPYKIFSPGSGKYTRSVTLQVVSSKAGFKRTDQTSRARETIYLRNISDVNGVGI